MSAPLVAGAAAWLLARNPNWDANHVRARLIATGEPLNSSLEIGSVRLDLFEALFNGSFEDNIYAIRNLRSLSRAWVSEQSNTSQKEMLGNIEPYHRKHMIEVSTGNTGEMVQAELIKDFAVPSDVTSFNIAFDYNFISEEYPEYVDEGFNDTLIIQLQNYQGGMIGSPITLVQENIDEADFVLWTDNPPDFPDGDDTVGQTGRQTVCRSIDIENFAVSSGNKHIRFLVTIEDRGDGIYDSVVLLDAVRFPEECPPN